MSEISNDVGSAGIPLPPPGADGSVNIDGSIKGSGHVDKKASSVYYKDEMVSSPDTHTAKIPHDPKNPSLPPPSGGDPLDPNSQSYFSGASIAAAVSVMVSIMAIVAALKEIKQTETDLQTKMELESRNSAKLSYEQTEEGVEANLAQQRAATVLSCVSASVQFAGAVGQAGIYANATQKAKDGIAAETAAQGGRALTLEQRSMVEKRVWDSAQQEIGIISSSSQSINAFGSSIADQLRAEGQAEQTMDQAQAELYSDSKNAYGRAAADSAESAKQLNEAFRQLIDALVQSQEKAQQALAQFASKA